MEYTDIGYSALLPCIPVCEAEDHNWRTDGLQMNVWGEQSHAYIDQSHPNWKHILAPCDGITRHQVPWPFLRELICECQKQAQLEEDVSKMIVWGEQSHGLHNQAPNWNTIDSLWLEYTDIRYKWHYYLVIDSVSARAGRLGDGWSPNELCEGEQSHAYIIKDPIGNTIDSFAMEYTDSSGTVTYYV